MSSVERLYQVPMMQWWKVTTAQQQETQSLILVFHPNNSANALQTTDTDEVIQTSMLG